MTDAIHLHRDPTQPYFHDLRLTMDWQPLAGLWVITGSEFGTGKRPATWFELRTQRRISEEEERDALAILDTRAHMMLTRFLEVQAALF